jgi:hypothetical protein
MNFITAHQPDFLLLLGGICCLGLKLLNDTFMFNFAMILLFIATMIYLFH